MSFIIRFISIAAIFAIATLLISLAGLKPSSQTAQIIVVASFVIAYATRQVKA